MKPYSGKWMLCSVMNNQQQQQQQQHRQPSTPPSTKNMANPKSRRPSFLNNNSQPSPGESYKTALIWSHPLATPQYYSLSRGTEWISTLYLVGQKCYSFSSIEVYFEKKKSGILLSYSRFTFLLQRKIIFLLGQICISMFYEDSKDAPRQLT